MTLFGLAGGAAGPSSDVLLGACGVFVITPAIVLLTLIAWVADEPRAAWTALGVAGLSYLAALLAVATFEPLQDGEVLEEQAMSRRWMGRYEWLTVLAAGSLGAFWARRAIRRLRPRTLSVPPRKTLAERLEMVERMKTRGLLTDEEAAGLRPRLTARRVASPNTDP